MFSLVLQIQTFNNTWNCLQLHAYQYQPSTSMIKKNMKMKININFLHKIICKNRGQRRCFVTFIERIIKTYKVKLYLHIKLEKISMLYFYCVFIYTIYMPLAPQPSGFLHVERYIYSIYIYMG